MASRQLNLNGECGARNEVVDDDDVMQNDIDGDVVNNNIDDNSDITIDLAIEQLREVFRTSLDLNRPMSDTIMTEENDFSDTYFDKVENAERKCPVDVEMKASEDADDDEKTKEDDEEEKTVNLDLSLSLSPPGVNPKQDASSKSNPSEISSASTATTDQQSCLSLDLNSESPDAEEKKTDEDDGIPSLILMGCSRCMMYVMVSEAEPSCPKCKTTVLIDQFRGNPTKKSRRN